MLWLRCQEPADVTVTKHTDIEAQCAAGMRGTEQRASSRECWERRKIIPMSRCIAAV